MVATDTIRLGIQCFKILLGNSTATWPLSFCGY